MAKKKTAQFETQTDPDGNTDRRMNLRTEDVPEAAAEQAEDLGGDYDPDAVEPLASDVGPLVPPADEAPQVERPVNTAPVTPPEEAAADIDPNEAAEKREELGAIEKLTAIWQAMKSLKEDDVVREWGLHRMHYHMIKEMGEKLDKGKPVHLSDGNKELLGMTYARLKAKGRFWDRSSE